jgi:DNA-binding transcriptional MocR family regulator
MRNCLRLSFAFYAEPEIREGMARLGRALRAAAS